MSNLMIGAIILGYSMWYLASRAIYAYWIGYKQGRAVDFNNDAHALVPVFGEFLALTVPVILTVCACLAGIAVLAAGTGHLILLVLGIPYSVIARINKIGVQKKLHTDWWNKALLEVDQFCQEHAGTVK